MFSTWSLSLWSSCIFFEVLSCPGIIVIQALEDRQEFSGFVPSSPGWFLTGFPSQGHALALGALWAGGMTGQGVPMHKRLDLQSRGRNDIVTGLWPRGQHPMPQEHLDPWGSFFRAQGPASHVWVPTAIPGYTSSQQSWVSQLWSVLLLEHCI